MSDVTIEHPNGNVGVVSVICSEIIPEYVGLRVICEERIGICRKRKPSSEGGERGRGG